MALRPLSNDYKNIIVSLGGNAIIQRGERGTVEEQFRNLEASCGFIADLVGQGRGVIITHGNGPIVGNILIRGEAAREAVPPMPLYVCDADSEGGIGFMIQQTLYNKFKKARIIKEIAAVVTQAVVDKNDPAFKDPSKPIGPFYSKKEAAVLFRKFGYTMKEDSRRGMRRFVASPRPRRIVEAGVIKMLACKGVVVIAAGGGGVPVAERKDGTLVGIDAVIDKDFATAMLAKETERELLINLTSVDMVYSGFGTKRQKGIARLSMAEAERLLKKGEFAEGSMRPKIEAAIQFLSSGGAEVIITSPRLIGRALKAGAGTRIRG